MSSTSPFREIVKVAAWRPFQVHPVPKPASKEPLILPYRFSSPESIPESIPESLVSQKSVYPLTLDGPVAPPEVLSRLWNETVASNKHSTVPDAIPASVVPLAVLADTEAAGT